MERDGVGRGGAGGEGGGEGRKRMKKMEKERNKTEDPIEENRSIRKILEENR